MYVDPETLNVQSTPAAGLIKLSDDQLEIYNRYNGFVKLSVEDAAVQVVGNDYSVQRVVANVEPDIERWEAWKAERNDNAGAQTPTSLYIPTADESAIVMMRMAFAAQYAGMDGDQLIECSGLAETWEPGDHNAGEIYNAGDQTWECYQPYSNAVYPDVKPGDPSWHVFNRPIHGKSFGTARPFVPVQGSHDMYRVGECAVYTDGNTYRCKTDTNFSPVDYPDAWEVING